MPTLDAGDQRGGLPLVSPGDLADAVEELAVMAIVKAADRAGHLDDLEDELFRFSRIVNSHPTCGPCCPIRSSRRSASRSC